MGSLPTDLLDSLYLLEDFPITLLSQLSDGADVNTQDEKGNTACHYAAEAGHDTIVIDLVKAGSDVNIYNYELETVLHKAVSKCGLYALKIILEQDADVNAQNRFGCTPLMSAVLTTNEDVLDLLIHKSADVNIPNVMNSTVLHLACGRGLTECVKLLTKAGAELDVQDNEGMTPVMWAVGQGHLNVIQLMMELGSNPNTTDYKGNTLLHDVVCLGQTHLLHYFLAEQTVEVNRMNKQGITPLIEAARCARRVAIEALLLAGADVNLGNVTTPLIETAYFGDYDNARTLLKYRANPNKRNKNKQLPLYWAIFCKHPKLVKLLLQANSDTNDVHNGDSAVYVAAAKGCWEELEILWNAGCDMNKVYKCLGTNSNVKAPRVLPAKVKKCPWLLPALANPRTLQVLCREAVRKCLGISPDWRIDALPVPASTKSFLCLEQL